MDGKRRILPLAGLLFTIGIANLVHFGEHVRTVVAGGLSGAGFSIGVGFTLVVFTLSGKVKP